MESRTSRGLAIGGGVLGLLGLVAWLLFGGAEREEGAGEEALAPPAVGRGELAPGAPPAELDAPREAAETAEAAGSVAPAGRTEVPLEGGAGEGRVEIRLVGPGGVPSTTAGATVRIREKAGAEERRAFADLDALDALFAPPLAASRLADGEGRLWIATPAADAPTLLDATAGALWGRARIDADDKSPVEVALSADATLRARVVDVTGAPVPGTRVSILRKQPRHSYVARTVEARGPEAIAIFPHAQQTVRARGEVSFSLAPDALLDPPVEHPLDPAGLPSEVVTLVLPAFGAVEVAVLDADGEPFAGEGSVSLALIRPGEPREVSPFDRQPRRRIERTIEAGRAVFPLVGCGLELEVGARREGTEVPARVFGPGPARPGETAAFRLRIGAEHPVVLLQALDAEGAPIAAETLVLRLETRAHFGGGSSRRLATTDAAGRFRVDLERGWSEGDRRVLAVLRGRESDPEASAEIDLSREIPAGLTDLGPVVLASPPLLVAGAAAGAGGEPIAGAILDLWRRTSGRDWWEPVGSFHQESAVDGTFAVRGVFAGERFRLGATAPGYARAEREFAPGEEGIVLVMPAEGAIAGTILLDEAIPREILRVVLAEMRRGESMTFDIGRRAAGGRLDNEGSFRIGGLSPGTYEAQVRANDGSEPLFTAADIAVRSGETTHDPRLDPLDLRGALFLHRITLVLPDPAAGFRGELRYGPAGAAKLEQSAWLSETRLDLLARAPLLDLDLSAPRFRPERREGVGGEIEIHLRAGILVRLLLRSEARLPEPPLHVKAALLPAGGDEDAWRLADWSAPAFDERRELLLQVSAPGLRKVVWLIERRSAGSSHATGVDLEREQIVEIQDVPGEQIVEVTLTQAEMDELVGALE
ncbi:MAG: carboxypeptidase-like regulatory domain-containing protein [Planctomycetota bacterium]